MVEGKTAGYALQFLEPALFSVSSAGCCATPCRPRSQSLSPCFSPSLSLTARPEACSTSDRASAGCRKNVNSAVIVMPFQKLLGPVLKDSARNDIPTSSLEGKVVALYFSASW